MSLNVVGECEWTAYSFNDWMTLLPPTTGSTTSTATVSLVVHANTTNTPRTGFVAMGGRLYTLTQSTCVDYLPNALSPDPVEVGATGSQVFFEVFTIGDCNWTVESTAPSWLIPSAGGTGHGWPYFNVLPNGSNTARTGLIGVGGVFFAVRQAAGPVTPPVPVPVLGPPHNYSIGETEVTFNSARNVLEATSTSRAVLPFFGQIDDEDCECTLYWSLRNTELLAHLYAPESQTIPVINRFGDILENKTSRFAIEVPNPWDGVWKMETEHYEMLDWYSSPFRTPQSYLGPERLFIGQSRDTAVVGLALKLFLDVDEQFDPANPGAEIDAFLPGSFPDKTSRPLPVQAGAPIHTVRVFAAYVDSSGAIVAPPDAGVFVDFDLEDVSQFAGIAMNAPDSRGTNGPDITFASSRSAALGQMGWPHVGYIRLSVWDYGAIATVKATHRGRTVELRLPVDVSNGLPNGTSNGLPDAGWNVFDRTFNEQSGEPQWTLLEEVSDSGRDRDDLDDTPDGNGVPGDNLVQFEEYRGFVIRGNHYRTSPRRKDLFVHSFVLGPIFDDAKGTQLRFHFPAQVDILADRRNINFNSAGIPGHVDQHALLIFNAGISSINPTWLGVAPCAGHLFPQLFCWPNLIGSGANDWLIDHNVQIYDTTVRRGTLPSPGDITPDPDDEEAFRVVYGHEIGHAVGIRHNDIDFDSIMWDFASFLSGVFRHFFAPFDLTQVRVK